MPTEYKQLMKCLAKNEMFSFNYFVIVVVKLKLLDLNAFQKGFLNWLHAYKIFENPLEIIHLVTYESTKD